MFSITIHQFFGCLKSFGVRKSNNDKYNLMYANIAWSFFPLLACHELIKRCSNNANNLNQIIFFRFLIFSGNWIQQVLMLWPFLCEVYLCFFILFHRIGNSSNMSVSKATTPSLPHTKVQYHSNSLKLYFAFLWHPNVTIHRNNKIFINFLLSKNFAKKLFEYKKNNMTKVACLNIFIPIIVFIWCYNYHFLLLVPKKSNFFEHL